MPAAFVSGTEAPAGSHLSNRSNNLQGQSPVKTDGGSCAASAFYAPQGPFQLKASHELDPVISISVKPLAKAARTSEQINNGNAQKNLSTLMSRVHRTSVVYQAGEE
jgi:hypothetical protein